MISILVETELRAEVEATVAREDGLAKLLTLTDNNEDTAHASLKVSDGYVYVRLNWQKGIPPVLVIDALPYNEHNLLGLIFLQLGAYEKAAIYLGDFGSIRDALQLALQMQYGNLSYELVKEKEAYSEFERYSHLHNRAVCMHYQGHQQEYTLEYVIKTYGEALAVAPTDGHYAFTTRQLADLYLDMGYLAQAEESVRQAWQRHLSEPAHHALQAQLIQVLIRKIKPEHQKLQLAEITVLLKETLDYYQHNQQPLELGMLSMDAAWVAQLRDHFSEGLACINQAIKLFEQEGVPELQGDAWIRKGTLLYAWAQKGQPFHQQAIDSYRQALKIFSKDVAPYVHADIHHHLALIYTEMPNSKEKKAMLNALATSSYQEALKFFNKEQFAYEYGCVCNNFGNALVKFPDSAFQNTTEKAIFYFEESLSVRQGSHYPYERASTLLNLLEAYWQLPLEAGQREEKQKRWRDMENMLREVKELVVDKDSVLRQQAEEHRTALEKAKNSYA